MKLRDPVSFPVSTPFIFELRLVSIISLIFFCWLFVQSKMGAVERRPQPPARSLSFCLFACVQFVKGRGNHAAMLEERSYCRQIFDVWPSAWSVEVSSGHRFFSSLTVRIQTHSVVIDNSHSNWNWLPQNISIKLSPGYRHRPHLESISYRLGRVIAQNYYLIAKHDTSRIRIENG